MALSAEASDALYSCAFCVCSSTRSPVKKIASGDCSTTAARSLSLSFPNIFPCRSLSTAAVNPSKPSGRCAERQVNVSVCRLTLPRISAPSSSAASTRTSRRALCGFFVRFAIASPNDKNTSRRPVLRAGARQRVKGSGKLPFIVSHAFMGNKEIIPRSSDFPPYRSSSS